MPAPARQVTTSTLFFKGIANLHRPGVLGETLGEGVEVIAFCA